MFSLKNMVSEMVPATVQNRSLREAYWRHRFKAPPPPPPTPFALSMRKLASRRDPSIGATRHTLLAYNTFLMRLDIYVIDYLMDRLKDAIDAIVDPLVPDVPLVSGAIEDAIAAPFKLGVDVLKSILPSGKITPEEGKKPALNVRASELGQALASGNVANIVAMCEVWTDDLLARIVTPLSSAGLPVNVIKGPQTAGADMMGSGLCVLGINKSISKVAEHVFASCGDKLKDVDAWARKSVILTRVNVGVGTIDLYSTHLHSGGDMPPIEAHIGKLNIEIPTPWPAPNIHLGTIDFGTIRLTSNPTEQEKHNVRINQCKEIAEFIKSTHNPQNVAILVGDFNIDAGNGQNYKDLCSALKSALAPAISIYELWNRQYGNTANGMSIGDLNQVCLKKTPEDTYCDETQNGQGGNRIDYIFVEPPTAKHSFNLDITVIKREPFKRSVATENMEFLSDHLGLSVDLLCSP